MTALSPAGIVLSLCLCQQVEVFIVEQTVHSDEGVPMSCQYYLLSDG